MTSFIIFFATVAALIAVYIFLIAPEHDKEGFPKDLLCPYAHRGLHDEDLPENSLPAFREAKQKGYGIELDVRLSKDGEVMVFHDDTLLRMCGLNAAFESLAKEELERLYLLYSDCKIPTFREVLELIDGSVPLLIELKGENGNTELCDRLFSLLDAYNGPFLIESFNPLLLAEVRKKRPTYKRGQLVDILSKESYKGPAPVRFMLSHLWLNFLSRPAFIAYNVNKAPRFAIFLCSHFFGAQKFAWTVKNRETYSSLRESGISSIFENFKPYSQE